MSNILRTKALLLTLFLTTCAHKELKSPCHDAKLAAAPGAYIPCTLSKPINRLAAINIETSKNS